MLIFVGNVVRSKNGVTGVKPQRSSDGAGKLRRRASCTHTHDNNCYQKSLKGSYSHIPVISTLPRIFQTAAYYVSPKESRPDTQEHLLGQLLPWMNSANYSSESL